MKLSLNDLKLLLECVEFNLEVLTDNVKINDDLGEEIIENLDYIRNELEEEIIMLTTTRIDINY